MKKKLVALFAAALMTVSFAGNAMAALWLEGDLIRVVYDTVGGNEVATDLGSLSTVSAGGTFGGGVNAVTLAQFTGSNWSSLHVAYFMLSQTPTQTAAVSGAFNGSVTSEAGGYTSFQPGASLALGQYAATALVSGATATVSLPKSTTNSFYTQLDVGSGVAQGDFGGLIVTTTNAAGAISLAALATTGYVDQTLFTWSNSALDAAGRLAGTKGVTLTTMADGSTVINGGAAAVPVPPAFFLMGSGLLGIFGVRRKMNA